MIGEFTACIIAKDSSGTVINISADNVIAVVMDKICKKDVAEDGIGKVVEKETEGTIVSK